MPKEGKERGATYHANFIDLRERGIDEAAAAELRARLASFAEDWNSSQMEIYDNYEALKINRHR